MNNLLEVKLRYNSEKYKGYVIGTNLKANRDVSVEKVRGLKRSLQFVMRYYDDNTKLVDGFFVDVHYNDIVPKSNRIVELIKGKGKKANDYIVGARFSDAAEGEENHIITYYIDAGVISDIHSKLSDVELFLKRELGGTANRDNFNIPNEAEKQKGKKELSISYDEFQSENYIRQLVCDCSVIEGFSVPNVTAEEEKETVLVTFFHAERSVSDILESLGVEYSKYHFSYSGKDTISASWELYQLLTDKVPYMISMISADLSKLVLEQRAENFVQEALVIPKPTTEPVIGVIDNFFDDSVYFSEWVSNTDYLDDYEPRPRSDTDRMHGTEVTSIIVDGPALNPELNDGCGRFRVRHFGVCERQITVSRLVEKVKRIIAENPDIHVWNLSLGTEDEISKNYISYDAAALDEIQANNNVIFVVSGTNDNRGKKEDDDLIRIGSPADSLNSIVVNSVRRDGKPASYTRKGTVLSFFNKPDVSYYGGDYDESERICVYSSKGKRLDYGTSLAAPWIARKLCYLIDVLGMNREVAKALIIDAAAEWKYKQSGYLLKDQCGYGVVPISIFDIISSDNAEIRFILSGVSDAYKISNYQIPIPKDSENKYPYVARATLCYFPECKRSQGVDYTTRELSLKFGIVNGKGAINDINDNVQGESGSYVNERTSRKEFRKWENTKFISRLLRKNRTLKSYDDRMWGISITSNERLEVRERKKLNFGAVVTLREINGFNRIQDFIIACSLRNIIVNEISIENRLDIFHTIQQEIVFEDDVELEDE